MEDSSSGSQLINNYIGMRRSEKLSMLTLYFTCFIGATGYSIILTSAWEYLKDLDPDVKTKFLGFVVGSFSCGQLIGSPLLGLSTQRFGFLFPLLTCLTLMLLGNSLYAYLLAFRSTIVRKLLMVFARFIIGLGSANVAIVRSFTSVTTTLEERTAVLSNVSAAQALGFIFGPLMQLLFTTIGEKGVTVPLIQLRISMYTAPALFSIALICVNYAMFAAFFTDPDYVTSPQNPSVVATRECNGFPGSTPDNDGEDEEQPLLTRKSHPSHSDTLPHSPAAERRDRDRDNLALVLCNVLWFVILACFAFFETVMVPVYEAMFRWSEEKVVSVTSLVLGLTSFLTVAVMVAVRFLAKRVKERHILPMALACLALSFFVCLSYSSARPPVASPTQHSNSSSNDSRGCDPERYSWCHSAHQIYLAQFIVASLFSCVGYSASVVLLSSLYSKVVGPFPQGLLQGLFTASGSMARLVAPVYASSVLYALGPLPAYLSMGLFVSAFVLLTLVFNRRFVQHILTRDPEVSY